MTELTHDGTSKTLETPRGTLHYHEAGDGPPLLLLHGSGPGVSGWANFRGNLGVFAEPHHAGLHRAITTAPAARRARRFEFIRTDRGQRHGL